MRTDQSQVADPARLCRGKNGNQGAVSLLPLTFGAKSEGLGAAISRHHSRYRRIWANVRIRVTVTRQRKTKMGRISDIKRGGIRS